MVHELELHVSVAGGDIEVCLTDWHGSYASRRPNAVQELDLLKREFRAAEKAGLTPQFVVDFGSRLFKTLIPEEIAAALQACATNAIHRGDAIRLVTLAPEKSLCWIPFEWLRIESSAPGEPLDGALCLQPNLRLVRRVGNPSPRRWTTPNPLRVLTIAANPGTANRPKLGWIDAESNAILAAFGRRKHQEYSIRRVFDAVPALVQRAIEEHRPHIVHFSGHCDRLPTGSYLALQGAEPHSESLLPIARFAAWLANADTILVVLHACDSAGDPLAAAEVLAAKGIPAVCGVRGKAIDAAMPQIARTFYSSLLDGADVDAAHAEARQAGATPFASILYLSEGSAPLILPSWHETPTAHPSRLPQFEGAFVGREEWLDKVIQAFRDGRRAVSIVGAGGIGKTRLAVQAGKSLLANYPDGVWLVQCDAITDSDGLYFAIGAALAITVSDDSTCDAVIDHLRDRRLLLVLDCFEAAVAAGMAPEVARLLASTSSSCLVTSRSALEIENEQVVRLEALGLPDQRGAMCESVALFLQSAGLEPGNVTNTELTEMGQLCETLQGMPLAIQLAGRRHRVLDLKELTSLLEASPLRTLEGEVSPLSLAIRRSLSLVSPKDRHLLWQLSVFVGSFTWNDLKAVISGDPFDLLDGMSRISEQGLVQVDRVATGKRYRIFDTVREYMTSTVQSEELAKERFEARERHSAYFAGRAMEVEQAGRLDELWGSIANFRAGLAFAAAQGHSEQVATLCNSLARSYAEAGLYRDFDELATKGLVAFRALQDPHGEIRLLGLMGAISARRGDEEACRGYWRNRATLCESVGDHEGAADTWIDLAVQYHRDGDLKEWDRLLALAEEHLRLKPKPELLATAEVFRAAEAAKHGRIEEARRRGEATEWYAAQATDHDPMLFVHLNLGRTWAGCGDDTRAEAAFVRVIRQGIDSKRYSQAAIASMELGELYKSTSLQETRYLALASAVRILEHLRSRRLPEAKERLNAFRQQQEAGCHMFEAEWHKTPWSEMIEEVVRRANHEGG